MKKYILIILLIFLGMYSYIPAYANVAYNTYTYTYEGQPVDSPYAYVPQMVISGSDLGIGSFSQPSDIFVTADNFIYILDTLNNRLICLDNNFQLVNVITGFDNNGIEDTFSNPEGIFVSERNEIYIADTGNNRITVIDKDGRLIRIYDAPIIKVIEDLVYNPSKLTVDKAGRMYIIAKGINRGIIEADADGDFIGFIGAPRVVPDMVEIFWRMFSTDEQKRRGIRFVPTEYNNVTIDGNGFIFGTIGALDHTAIRNAIINRDNSGNITPIKKLNPQGVDILQRNGFFPPVGDISFMAGSEEGPSIIVDVIVDEDGSYSLLDSKRGRVFTYDSDGNLLYVFGGRGNQIGTFSSPAAIDIINKKLLVLDKGTGYLTIFRRTEYGESIHKALELDFEGKYEEATDMWNEVLQYNSNFYQAYIGLGRSYLRNGDYDKAMNYLRIANEKDYFSRAFGMKRRQIIDSSFPYIFSIFSIALLVFVIKNTIKKYAKKGKNT